MTKSQELFSARSWLFAPGDSEKKMQKAADSAADIALFDLEDAVADAEKPKARTLVQSFLKAQAGDHARLWVRINPLQGEQALLDLAAVMPGRKGQAMRKQNRTAAMVMRKSVSPDQSNALRGTCGAAGGACAPILLAEGSAAADGIGGGTDGISSIMEALSPPGAS